MVPTPSNQNPSFQGVFFYGVFLTKRYMILQESATELVVLLVPRLEIRECFVLFTCYMLIPVACNIQACFR